MDTLRKSARTFLLASVGFMSSLVFIKDHASLPLESQQGGTVSRADLACIDESQGHDDELYFISCGGIY